MKSDERRPVPGGAAFAALHVAVQGEQRRHQQELAEDVGEGGDVGDGVHGGGRDAEDQGRRERDEEALCHRQDERVEDEHGRRVEARLTMRQRKCVEAEELEFAPVDEHGQRAPVRGQVAEGDDVAHVGREAAGLDVAQDEEVVAEEVVVHRRDVDADDEAKDEQDGDVAGEAAEGSSQARSSAGSNSEMCVAATAIDVRPRFRSTIPDGMSQDPGCCRSYHRPSAAAIEIGGGRVAAPKRCQSHRRRSPVLETTIIGAS